MRSWSRETRKPATLCSMPVTNALDAESILTRAAVSVLTFNPSGHAQDSFLRAANGTRISSFGNRSIPLRLGGNSYRHNFVLADMSSAILDADFLGAHNLVVNVAARCLTHTTAATSVELEPSLQSSTALTHVQTSAFDSLLFAFTDLLKPTFDETSVQHEVQHFIPTTGPSISSKVRRLGPERLTQARAEFDRMLCMGIIRRSSSP